MLSTHEEPTLQACQQQVATVGQHEGHQEPFQLVAFPLGPASWPAFPSLSLQACYLVLLKIPSSSASSQTSRSRTGLIGWPHHYCPSGLYRRL